MLKCHAPALNRDALILKYQGLASNHDGLTLKCHGLGFNRFTLMSGCGASFFYRVFGMKFTGLVGINFVKDFFLTAGVGGSVSKMLGQNLKH